MQEASSEDAKTLTYYEFIYIESMDKIVSWRAPMDLEGDLIGPVTHNNAYILTVYRKKNGAVGISCDCMGHTQWHHCKHADFCRDAFDFWHTVKPTSFINQTKEEYVKDWLLNQTEVFDIYVWKKLEEKE